MSEPADPEPAGSLSQEVVKWQLDDQAEGFRASRTHLNLIAALNSLIVGIFAITFAVLVREPAPHDLAMAAAALAGFLLTIGCTTAALQSRRRRRPPLTAEVLRLERESGENVARAWVVEELARAHDLNEAVLRRMERWARAAEISTFVDTILVIAAVYAALFA